MSGCCNGNMHNETQQNPTGFLANECKGFCEDFSIAQS
jgi:hypothetical protein